MTTVVNTSAVQPSVLVDNLTELAYSRYASHYSRRNWCQNEPLFAQLSSKDREFWRQLIISIKTNFKPTAELPPCDPVAQVKLDTPK